MTLDELIKQLDQSNAQYIAAAEIALQKGQQYGVRSSEGLDALGNVIDCATALCRSAQDLTERLKSEKDT